MELCGLVTGMWVVSSRLVSSRLVSFRLAPRLFFSFSFSFSFSFVPGCGDVYAADSTISGGSSSGAPATAPRDRIGTWFGQAPTGKGVGLEAYVEEDEEKQQESRRAADTGPRSLVLVDTRDRGQGQLR